MAAVDEDDGIRIAALDHRGSHGSHGGGGGADDEDTIVRAVASLHRHRHRGRSTSPSVKGKQPTQEGGDSFDTPPPRRCGQRRRLDNRQFLRRFACVVGWRIRRNRYKVYIRTQTPIQNQIRIQFILFKEQLTHSISGIIRLSN